MMRSHRNHHLHHNHDHHSRLLHDLSTLVINLLRSPPSPIPFPDDPSSTDLVTRRSSSITPAGFTSLMLGMSLALMLCGSVTFFIGFMIMPWVLGLLVLLYVAGIVSALSFLACYIICFTSGPPSPKKDIPSWKLLWGDGMGRRESTNYVQRKDNSKVALR